MRGAISWLLPAPPTRLPAPISKMLLLLQWYAVPGFVMPGSARAVAPMVRVASPPHLGFFDDVKEKLREVKVQHILVEDEAAANKVYESIVSEGASAETVGRFAASQSTCGSAKKTPNAKLQLLRGQPGELTFRRGAMAAEFEKAAFAAAPGSLLQPLRTKFGWHVIFVNEDSPPPTGGGGDRAGTSMMAMCSAGEPSTAVSVASIASKAAVAMREGRALVQPLFLSGDALAAARADMHSVFQEDASGDAFESIQTDLLDPEFRKRLPSLPFADVLGQLDELREALAASTGRTLLDGGGLHLMRYPIGSKFMRHVDEDSEMAEPVRNSVSFLIYLTPDDWSAEDGGALLIHEGGEAGEPREVLPVGGTLVVYDSTTEHEVLPTRRERHLLSGRFKQLDEDWQRERV